MSWSDIKAKIDPAIQAARTRVIDPTLRAAQDRVIDPAIRRAQAHPTEAKVAAAVAVAVPVTLFIAKKRKNRRERLRQMAAEGGMPSLSTPPHPSGQMPPINAEPEVFAKGFNIHEPLSTVPTLLDGAVTSPHVRWLAQKYERNYETPDYDATAAINQILAEKGKRSR